MRILRLAAFVLAALLAGCGKYRHPVPPEAVSPAGVRNLQVQGSIEGVSFLWASPSTDRRGKPLQSLYGYDIMRKTVVGQGDVVNAKVRYDKIAYVEDHSLEELKSQQEQLRAEEKPTHRAKADPEMQKFQYLDTDVEAGKQYVYKIVPESYNGRGAVPQLVRILFRGDASEITIFESGEDDTDLTEDAFIQSQ